MGADRKLKRLLMAGAAAGAAMTVVITLLMDVLYADALGGTWRQAIAKDLHTFFSIAVPEGSLLVTAIFLVILLLLGSFGALMGLIFAFFVYSFLEFLLKK